MMSFRYRPRLFYLGEGGFDYVYFRGIRGLNEAQIASLRALGAIVD